MRAPFTDLSHTVARAILIVLSLSLTGPVSLYGSEPNTAKDDEASLVQPQDQVPDFEARLTLARLRKQQGQWAQALEQYQRLLELRPDKERLRIEYASTLLDAQRPATAQTELQQVLERHPRNIQALNLMARIQVQMNQPQAAKQTVQRITRLSKDTSPEALSSLARLYADLGRTAQAGNVLQRIPITDKMSAAELADRADISHRIGHARQCKKLYERALAKNDTWSIRRRFANRMLMWGAFYRAARIYRSRLEQTSGLSGTGSELISVLASSERYAEAIQLCRKILLETPGHLPTRIQLCRIYMDQKRFQKALTCASNVIKRDPNHSEGWFLKGAILNKLRDYKRAIAALARVGSDSKHAVSSLILRGKVHRHLGETELARKQFDKALHRDPSNIRARFHLAATQKRRTDEFLRKLFNREDSSAPALTRWAQLYNTTGQRTAAIRCYQQALSLDPAYFPARIGLAETHSYNNQYERSLVSLRRLHDDFPESRKILLTRARANSWGENYEKALTLYSRLHREMPPDPLPLREKARTAMWGKMFDVAMRAYSTPLKPSINTLLRHDIRRKVPRAPSAGYDILQRIIEAPEESRKPYGLYSRLQSKTHNSALSPAQNEVLAQILRNRYAQYRIQKTFWLERRAKRLNWHRQRLSALEAYKQVIQAEPNNNEARFDLAQIQCGLGLVSRQRSTYKDILHLDPLHNLAGKALDRLRVRTSPALDVRYSFWHEWGRGQLSNIRRQRTGLGLSIPIIDNHTIRLSTIYLADDPAGHNGFYGTGQRIRWTGVWAPALRSSVALQTTNYRNGDPEDTLTGHARLSYNIQDYVTLGVGYRRQNEFFNVFGLRDGTQSNRWWIALTSDLNHNLEAGYRGQYIDYSDDNAAQHHSGWVDYMFLDHPHQLNLEGRMDYRDTHENNRFIFQGTRLRNIIHPYWTPRDYLEGTLTLKWRHDLSEFLFCGSQKHYYQIQISAGDNTDNNTFGEIKSTWNYEFANSWTINLSGLIHRSRDWDADGFWASLSYRF